MSKSDYINTDNRIVSNELLENPTFLGFLEKNDNSMSKLISDRGHDENMEDMFRDYLLKLPAGELKNDSILNRFMPGAVDRIEELQRQARESSDKKKWEDCIAETMVIRSMVGTQRNQKKLLSVRIPTNANLQGRIENIEKTLGFSKVCQDPNVRADYASTGDHGGLMIENLSKAPMGTDESQVYAVYNNQRSFNYQYSEMQNKAKNIINKALEADKNADKVKMQSCYRDARELLCQAFSLGALDFRDHPEGKNEGFYVPALSDQCRHNTVMINSDVYKKTIMPNETEKKAFTELNKFAKCDNAGVYCREKGKVILNEYQRRYPKMYLNDLLKGAKKTVLI